jgi:glycerol dehydrogenase-like iron-containing ADH family enzyme
VYDSLAKLLELNQRMLGKDEDEIDIGLRTSFELSKFLYERLSADFDEACHDIENGINSKKVYDCVYLAICVTGVVSGLARGSNQTAIGHKIYESARALFPKEVSRFLHGEVVAVGLIAQLAYNGEKEKAIEFANTMKSRNMKITLNEMGVEHNSESLELLYDKMLASSAMAGTDESEHAILKEALKLII